MDTLLVILVEVLRLVPLIMVFYIPSLFGMATLKEKGEAYRVKAGLWFGIALVGVITVELVFRSISAVQVAATVGTSLLQFAVALALAAFTVYRLAD
ncbi:hypothetical protein SIL72_01545 [Rubrobacter radiotolerans]|uniref:Uncharacterized protein n=1 Tax=Rubrobacter radiotolerans TaxID=42256 RepID=A0AB35SYN3_RUBRA|nr:hypothetical protein [Rubrobacter radiotolerans]MDX5892704.1 hypothetical protein [Rubrobacter radiotolerans]